jgi:hypothetical protein
MENCGNLDRQITFFDVVQRKYNNIPLNAQETVILFYGSHNLLDKLEYQQDSLAG